MGGAIKIFFFMLKALFYAVIVF